MRYFLTSTSAKSGYKGNVILDVKNNQISITEFQKLLAGGKVEAMNLSLQRLIEFNYDFDKLNSFYNEML